MKNLKWLNLVVLTIILCMGTLVSCEKQAVEDITNVENTSISTSEETTDGPLAKTKQCYTDFSVYGLTNGNQLKLSRNGTVLAYLDNGSTFDISITKGKVFKISSVQSTLNNANVTWCSCGNNGSALVNKLNPAYFTSGSSNNTPPCF